jgi:protocatechuate 3,4-dioxygenase beta subunit
MKLAATLLLTLLLASGAATLAQTAPAGTASLPAETTPEHSARAILQGMVTKDPSGEPVKKALIELITENQSAGGNYTALTTSEGAFRIEGILAGRYRLFAERTGYIEVDKHRKSAIARVLTLTAGQELKDVLIRLQAAAVVEGRVTDEDGDPLANSEVNVMRQSYASGHSRWEQAAGERTNDLGEYRISGLEPATYYISVTPPPDFKNLIETASNTAAPTGEPAPQKPMPTSYMTTYYPGTKDRNQAAPIQLHAGDDFPANFSLTRSPSLIIRGAIVNLPLGTPAAVMLQSREFSLTVSGAEMHKDGSFEIRDVAPGTYTLVAMTSISSEPLMARQRLQVTQNVDGLRLAPQTGAWLHGRIQLESKTTGKLDPSQIFLSLLCADGDDDVSENDAFAAGSGSMAHVSADGTFEWKSVLPGHYYVQLAAEGLGSPEWFLKSVVVGNRDVNDTGFSINGGAAVLDLVASANGAVVDGVVTNHKNETVASATVVLVPEARFRARTDRYHTTVSDQSGRFTLHGIPPGEYTLLAWENVDGQAYYNAEFLKTYEGQGKVLHVGEGERLSLQLTAIPAAEEGAPAE